MPKSIYEKPVSGLRKKNDQPRHKVIEARQIREVYYKISTELGEMRRLS